MNVRYFAIKDSINKGYLKVMHLGTNQMLHDFFTKPLQGSKFRDFRDLILGRIDPGGTAGAVGAR